MFEFVRPHQTRQEALARFFLRLEMSEARRLKSFAPRPLTPEEARTRAFYTGTDYYLLALDGETNVVGYGFLRWYPGFVRPSLGIAVDAEYENRGLGRALMEIMHAEARRRGCAQCRLRVHPENRRAVGLYQRLGYVWQPDLDRGELEGVKDL